MINEIKTLISGLSSLGQVELVSSLGGHWAQSDVSVDKQFRDIVGGRMHPLMLPEQHGYQESSIVVQKKNSNDVFIEMFPVFKADVFILSARSHDYVELVDLCRLITEKAAEYTNDEHAGAMIITGVAVDYEESVKSYRADFELIVSHLSLSSQDLPAVFLYEESRQASADSSGNRVKQTEQITVSALLIASASEIEEVRNLVKSELIGKTAGSDGEEIHLAGGRIVDVVGSMHVWKESFVIDQRWNA